MRKQEYKFTKGEKVSLDDIYEISSFFNGDWYYQNDPLDSGLEEEVVTIIKNVHFILIDKEG